MSRSHISVALRRLVSERAKFRCEYCLIPEWFTAFGCEVDHIISEKHQGQTTENNLALACGFCNQNKGSDLGSMLTPDSLEIIRFFHPRRDVWEEHFHLNLDMSIEPLTDIGRITTVVFKFNTPERFDERRSLQRLGLFP